MNFLGVLLVRKIYVQYVHQFMINHIDSLTMINEIHFVKYILNLIILIAKIAKKIYV